MKDPIDYRELLIKYMRGVKDCEGVTFIGGGGYTGDVTFSEEEIGELHSLEKEGDEKYG